MNEKKFVIHLTGQPATGKSTFANLLGEEYPGAYSIFYDRLKWQISGYNRERDRTLIRKLQEKLFSGALALAVPVIIVDFFFRDEPEYRALKQTAEDQGYIFLTIALSATRQTLAKRFDERLARSRRENFKMSIVDKDLFLESLKETPYLPADRLDIDTTHASIGENLTQVLAYLKEKGLP